MEVHASLGVLAAGSRELGASPSSLGFAKQRFEQKSLALLCEEPVAQRLDV